MHCDFSALETSVTACSYSSTSQMLHCPDQLLGTPSYMDYEINPTDNLNVYTDTLNIQIQAHSL